MKFKSQVYTEASGSVGGVTYSHNRGGLYTRARAIPVNPGSSFQTVIRGYMSQLAGLWVATLSAAQRAGWDAYAEAVPLPDPLGEPRNVGGLGMYTRSNVPRLQVGLTRVDDRPAQDGLGNYTQPGFTTMVASEAAQTLSIPFTESDNWVDEDDAAMLVWVSRPRNPSVNYFKGPYRATVGIPGDATTPPTSPVAVATPFAFVTGQKLFCRVNVTRANGRLSTELRGSVVAVA